MRITPSVLSVAFLCQLNMFAAYLGQATGVNAFMTGNFSSANSDTGGSLAAGGNISLVNFGVATSTNFTGQYAMVSGGDTTASNGAVYTGNVYVGGSNNIAASFNIGSGIVDGPPDPAPIDFVTTGLYLQAVSQSLRNLGGAAVNVSGMSFTLDAANNSTAVFYLDSSQFCTGCSVNIVNVAAGSSVFVNVAGVNVNGTNASYFINGQAISGGSSSPLARQVLFNYFEATSLYLNSGIQGSVLAPNADVVSAWGQMAGQLIARSYSSTCSNRNDCGAVELYDFAFDGGFETPEPGTMALVAVGLAVLMRRARK